jgi:hypothetical protein
MPALPDEVLAHLEWRGLGFGLSREGEKSLLGVLREVLGNVVQRGASVITASR